MKTTLGKHIFATACSGLLLASAASGCKEQKPIEAHPSNIYVPETGWCRVALDTEDLDHFPKELAIKYVEVACPRVEIPLVIPKDTCLPLPERVESCEEGSSICEGYKNGTKGLQFDRPIHTITDQKAFDMLTAKFDPKKAPSWRKVGFHQSIPDGEHNVAAVGKFRTCNIGESDKKIARKIPGRDLGE